MSMIDRLYDDPGYTTLSSSQDSKNSENVNFVVPAVAVTLAAVGVIYLNRKSISKIASISKTYYQEKIPHILTQEIPRLKARIFRNVPMSVMKEQNEDEEKNKNVFFPLSEELMVRILSCLSVTDLRRSMRVCRRWYRICNTVDVKKNLLSHHIPVSILTVLSSFQPLHEWHNIHLGDDCNETCKEFLNLNNEQEVKLSKTEKRWSVSRAGKPELAFDMPPVSWPKVKMKNSSFESTLICFLQSKYIGSHSVSLFVDAANRWGVAFQYLCTYMNIHTGKREVIEGVATLHQAYPKSDSPWVWVDNLDLDVSWNNNTPTLVDVRNYVPEDKTKRWFIFFPRNFDTAETRHDPKWILHCEWLKRFLNGAECGWLKDGHEYLDKDFLAPRIALKNMSSKIW